MSARRPVLLLGGTGLLGRALLAMLARHGHAVTAPSRAAWDLRDPALPARIQALGPGLVINAAAFTDVAAAELPRHRAEVHRLNVEVPAEAAAAAAELDVPLVHVSTDYVFDGRASAPYREEDPPAPLQVYGASKLEGERRVAAAHPRALVVRTSTLFGDRPGGRPTYVEAIVAQARRGGPVRVVELPVSSPTYAPDLAEAVVGLVRAGASGIVHVVNDGACSRLELARASVAAAGLEPTVPVEPRPAPEEDVRRPAFSVLATARLSTLLGRPLRPWSEALAIFVRGLPA